MRIASYLINHPLISWIRVACCWLIRRWEIKHWLLRAPLLSDHMTKFHWEHNWVGFPNAHLHLYLSFTQRQNEPTYWNRRLDQRRMARHGLDRGGHEWWWWWGAVLILTAKWRKLHTIFLACGRIPKPTNGARLLCTVAFLGSSMQQPDSCNANAV